MSRAIGDERYIGKHPVQQPQFWPASSSSPSPAPIYWRDLLESGEVKNIAEIARANKVDGSYVSRILDLSLFAPDIIEAILDGKEPSGLFLSKLTRREPPVLWEDQRRGVGFAKLG